MTAPLTDAEIEAMRERVVAVFDRLNLHDGFAWSNRNDIADQIAETFLATLRGQAEEIGRLKEDCAAVEENWRSAIAYGLEDKARAEAAEQALAEERAHANKLAETAGRWLDASHAHSFNPTKLAAEINIAARDAVRTALAQHRSRRHAG